MPTVCKITLDATEYRRELEAVVAASRAASARLTESFDDLAVNADLSELERLKAELAGLEGKDVTVTAEADQAEIERLKAELARLEGKDVTVTAEADQAEIERLKAELAALQGKDVVVAASADLVEIERLRAELAGLEGKDVVVAASAELDEIERLKAELAALQGKDVVVAASADLAEIEKLRAELAALEGKDVVVAASADLVEIERLRAELAALEGKSVNVAADVDLAEIERLKAELATLEGKGVNVTADVDLVEIERLRAELAALQGKDVVVAASADLAEIEKLRAELAALQGKDVVVAASADLAEIEKLRAELAALEGKSVNVAADVDLAEIERLKAELKGVPAVTVDVVANTVEIARLKDEIKTLEGREIEIQTAVVDEDIKRLQAELAALEGKDVSVTTDADQAEIVKLKAVIASLEDKKVTIRTDVKSDELTKLRAKLAATEAQAKGTSSIFGKLIPSALKTKAADAFGSIRKELNNTASGAQKFLETFLAGGGAIGIIVAGIASVGKIAMTVYNNWIGRMKEAGEQAQRNAASVRETAEANELLRQKSDGYLSQLQTLSSQEQLSNANKAEARKLITDLAKSYGDLGVKLDETTGKLTGVDAAMIQKAKRDKDRRIQELKAELEQLKADNDAQRNVMEKSGISLGVWWGEERQLGGQEDTLAAAKQIDDNGKRMMEINRALRDLRKSDPEEDIRAKKAGERDDLSESHRQQLATFKQRQLDDAFANESDVDAKIANRQDLIAQHRSDKIQPLEQAVATATATVEAATGDGRVEAERNLLQLQKELQTEREKAYGWERQIDDLRKQQANAYEKLTEQARQELDYNQLVAAGEYDKAAAMKLEKELKDQNLKLTAAETEELTKQRASLAAQNLLRSQRTQAYDLFGQAMEHAGRGREFSEQKAIREAREVKGRDLTDSETALVKKLSELSWGLANRRETQYGDMSVMSNNLTSRGGFQGGAKVPDSEKYNREIANTNKTMLQVLQRIEAINREMGVFR